jgi:hypothetical protein
MKIAAFGALTALFCTSALKADFTYEQTSQITGGMMASMMKFAGAFSKKAKEPIKSTVSVKGNRLVSSTADSANIIDLDKETITDVNFAKKTYSVMTFQQMMQALQQASEKMKESDAQVNVKASVKDGAQTKTINGLNTKLMIMTIETEMKDPKNNQSGTMVVTSDMWLAPSVPGYDEVKDFYKRMAAKLAWTPNSGFLSMGGAGVGKGMSALYKEGAKMDGVPVFQIIRMGMQGEQIDPATTQAAAEAQQEAEKRRAEGPNVGEAAANAATRSAANTGVSEASRHAGPAGGITGAVAGSLAGSLGGFGRKKKPAEQPKPATPPPAPPQQAASTTPAPAAAPGSLMVMSSELTSFSQNADASKFEVPAGFKQVESETLKRTK